MTTLLYRSAAAWTAIGLAGGLFYREFTRAHDVAGGTQLAVVHTHALTLGSLGMLLLLVLDVTFRLSGRRSFTAAVHAWNTGLLITVGGLVVKGCLQVMDSPHAASKALAGFSGLGHMTLTAAFILLFVALAPAVRTYADQRPTEAARESSPTPAA